MKVSLVQGLAFSMSMAIVSTGTSSDVGQTASGSQFHAVVDRYAVQDGLRIDADIVVGSGAAQRTGTAMISIAREGETTFQATTGDEQFAEIFQFRRGLAACKSTRSSMPKAPKIDNICGTPAPWFLPLPFLSKLSSRLYQVARPDSTTNATFSISQSDLVPGKDVVPSHAWESYLTFDAEGRLTTYSYPVAAARGSLQPLYIDVTYGDYQMFGNTLVPHHIRQSIGGQSTFDLTIKSINQEAR